MIVVLRIFCKGTTHAGSQRGLGETEILVSTRLVSGSLAKEMPVVIGFHLESRGSCRGGTGQVNKALVGVSLPYWCRLRRPRREQ